MIKKILIIIWLMIEAAYFPVYLIFWLLHKIARLLLAISYFGMFEKQMGKDIIINLFKWHNGRN